MEGLNEEDEGLPEVYLSPSRQYRTDRNCGPNDSDQNVWDDIEGETWVPLCPRLADDETVTRLDDDPQATYSLGMREEIEGISSLESSAAGSSTVTSASQSHTLSISEAKEPKRMPEGAGSHEEGSSHLLDAETKVKKTAKGDRVVAWSRQRGETPGSDCPPVAGAGAPPRTFRQNLKLDTNFSSQQSSELVFSPGGDEGFMVPGGVHAYYGSGSDTEGLEWSMGEEYQADSVAPYRDVVEGADSVTPVPQNYSGNGSSVGLRAMERNSPAGLSTPDADVDVTVAVARNLSSRKSKNSIRPPVVGQSEELLVQASRKDLGSTDGEESEEGGAKRPPIREDLFSAPETQPGSLGSQSENTDSVNTVLDMSRGEVQGCETEAVGTPLLSTPLTLEPAMSQPHHKPNFVIGGPISPRGKFRQFQNTVRGRMQDVKASLEIQPGLNLGAHVDREQFLSQPPLYAPVTPVCEQEVSLASMISVETNHPDSSDRVTSPSVLSVSSAASSKRLEWDSGADVGYAGNAPEQMSASLSTLERIAIGNYASVLRTEPEGTTQVKEKLKNSKKSYKACGAKGGGSLASVKRNIPEVMGSLPSRSLRVPQIRERKIVSSSDEEFDSRRTSPSQSPRRKPRRRSSLTLSDDVPVNLKAKKNSRNARNHGNIRRPTGNTSEPRGKSKDSKSGTNLMVAKGQKEVQDSSESVLESQVSLQSSNNSLQALSAKLKKRIQILLDQGTMKKVQDYNKLQDYIEFIGIPSTNEEECRLKHGVAGVITRMFGEIEADDTDASNTFNSETSETPTTDSHASENVTQSHSNMDFPPVEGDSLPSEEPGSSLCKSTSEKDEGQERSVTPGGTITLKAYRPPSASRTYFMAVSRDCDEGLVEGERTVTPESGPPSSLAIAQGLDFHRGQAEGQREDTESGIPSLSPRSWQQIDRSYPGTVDGFRKDGTSTPNVQDRGIIGHEIVNENENEEDSRSFSESVTLPPDWGLGLRRSQAMSSGAVTSDECSPRHVGRWSVLDRRSSWHEEDMNGRFRNTDDWKTATTRSERLYKDRRGTLHVANQPPGYMDDRDSHPSESTSEHEHHQRRSNDTESHDDGRRGAARPWTSSGSESAYETIRERHRHVDEALASSFEFYSTSPRDARLLGYMSSDAAKDEEADEAEELVQDESQADQMLSAASSEQLSTGRPVHTKKKVLRQQHTEEQNSTPSSHTDANDVSSQVSFIQLQKQKYVKRIQRHIHTLEKLERALMEQLGDSIGSEKSFRRCVTEGRSQTESDTNVRSQTRDILGQSETATSSIISSDYSDEVMEKCNRLKQSMKANSSHSRSSESQAGQESRSQSSGKKSESAKSATGFNSLGQSYMSSPRVAQSQMGSDLASSRASTLKRIEKEVKKLAITEEKSRQALHKGKRKPSTKLSLREDTHLQNAMRKMQREEPRGEEGPKKSQVKSAREISDDNLSIQAIRGGGSTPDDGRHLADKRSKIQKGKTEVTSDKQSTDRTISNSHFLRQGDGREARDGSQMIKVPAVMYKKNNDRLRVDSPPVRDIPRMDTKKITKLHDFGQMFPSVESFLSDDDTRHSCSEDGRSVGIQTGESLLCLAKSPVDNTVSHQHSNKVGKLHQKDVTRSESTMRERNQAKEKQSSRPSSGNGRDKREDIQRKNDVVIANNDRYLNRQIYPQEGESEGQPFLLKQTSRKGEVRHKDKTVLSSAPSSRPESGGETERQSSNNKSREKQKFNEDPKTSSRQVIGDSHPSYRTDNLEDNISSCREDPKKHFSDDTTKRFERTESSREEVNLNKNKHPSSRPVSAKAEPKQRMALNVDVMSDETKSNMQFKKSGDPTESSLSSQQDFNDDSGKEYSGLSDQRHNYVGNMEFQRKRQGSLRSSAEEPLFVLRDKTQSSPSQVSSTQRGDSNNLRSYHDHSFHSEDGIPLPVMNNYVRDKQEINDNQESFAVKGMRKQQRNNQQNEEYKKPVQFDISVGNKENYLREETPMRNLIIVPPVTPLVEKPRKDMTLQEALARARPGYVQGADDRRAMIRLKQEMRREAQNHNHKVVAQLPTNLQTPSTLQPSHPGVKQFRKAQSQTNRLMAGLYSQKLKKKVLKGQVSHAHKDILTPTSHCYKR
ncbi:hypothetical protein C7M84_012137 [Penaeus vannamei]|uniref:ALMS motif domain-containing protein n=1 Tax=Penaeus vannamei TaxID=6689 RepID=A0A3R7M212_PENVA|nr:hypothetical protein C7M84_012137 [Penaeus vannamei]